MTELLQLVKNEKQNVQNIKIKDLVAVVATSGFLDLCSNSAPKHMGPNKPGGGGGQHVSTPQQVEGGDGGIKEGEVGVSPPFRDP